MPQNKIIHSLGFSFPNLYVKLQNNKINQVVIDMAICESFQCAMPLQQEEHY